jgi:hypothetical protein
MKYAISLLRTEKLEYKKERYNTFEEAEKAFLAIPEDERVDFGIAEIHSPEEVAAMEAAPNEEV